MEEKYSRSELCRILRVRRRTLEILEEEGIVVPTRKGKTTTYTRNQVDEICFAVDLRREMGVNWAGVEVALRMRRNMERIGRQMEEIFDYLRSELEDRISEIVPPED